MLTNWFERINGNQRNSGTEKLLRTNSKIKLLDKVFFAVKKVTHIDKHSFLSDVKRVLYRQVCVTEYKAEIGDNIEKLMLNCLLFTRS